MRLLLSVVAGCALALTVGACSPDDPPPPAPTTASATPINPYATAPAMPDRATEFSPRGAATFVSYYVSVLDYASKTGDTEGLRALSRSDCSGCTGYIDLYESTYSSGGWFKGSDWSKTDSRLNFDRREGGESRVATTIRIESGTFRKSESAPVDKVAAVDTVVTFGLQYTTEWVMTHVASGDRL